jgi:hypothetical protein
MSFKKLRDFVHREMPMLDDVLGEVPRSQIPRVFNAATRLDYASSASIRDSFEHYLAALELEKARGTLVLGALARGLAEAAKIVNERRSTQPESEA